LTLEETSWVRSEVSKFVYLDAGFEAEDAFDVRERATVALEMPETDELIVEAEYKFGELGLCINSAYIPNGTSWRNDGY